jgi:hypothetical protein
MNKLEKYYQHLTIGIVIKSYHHYNQHLKSIDTSDRVKV